MDGLLVEKERGPRPEAKSKGHGRLLGSQDDPIPPAEKYDWVGENEREAGDSAAPGPLAALSWALNRPAVLAWLVSEKLGFGKVIR
ncbi:hypothetical protein ColTof4_11327 [Colletotrichum tofieldiae]|nr:hypothetical protein ColTof3_04514 [Colletotrichum tofieldiae]GKT78904.1 hypothetical protein ColTof4_11327 [Colletotrichum tofieldiae]GKT86879.1 hypothetical protein Ct61P_04729 [Colletotrichum tofieldiae]